MWGQSLLFARNSVGYLYIGIISIGLYHETLHLANPPTYVSGGGGAGIEGGGVFSTQQT